MKINNLTNGLVATLLLASPIVGAETEYPAADFKPKVIYQDTDSSQSKSTSAPTQQAKSVESTESDSKYPAANFEPKVLYKDADYKPSKFTETSSSTSERAMTGDVTVSGAPKAEEESMMSYLIGLVAFAVAGYLFLTKRESKAKASDSRTYSSHVSGLSGVARYLRKHNMGPVTGVARYLESQVASTKGSAATSSVQKYLEKQAKSAKEKSAQAATGVEKYMRDRG
ncbi:hypothetical protein [Methylobacter sp.]|uniref:hypothetical protein n=1 Tax=Methylobacter sp. TaxID=2051955 RepID=UPI0012292854|nr:hypothetical protein [Methylobacter sp.]TAK62328.1 MAG: hypothetical protein EPO18_11035 [Methylobacter sp.]